MSRKFLIASAGLLAALSAQASVSLTSASSTYTQNFDSLASTGSSIAWTNDSTLPGWSLVAAAPVTSYNTGNGSNGTIAGFYSFGATGSSERALGSVITNAFAGAAGSGTVYTVLSLTNDSGAAFNSFTLNYDGEQWRNNGNASAQSLVLQYGFGATYADVGTSWVSAGSAFNFTSPVVGNTAAIVDGNVAGKVAGIGGTVTTDWAAGSTLWVRWADLNDSGNDHLLAIDNVSLSVSAVPEPGTYAMLLAGMAAIGFVARRRRNV